MYTYYSKMRDKQSFYDTMGFRYYLVRPQRTKHIDSMRVYMIASIIRARTRYESQTNQQNTTLGMKY